MESCTSALGVFCVDRAGVRFNDRASDGEPHSQAFRLGRKELLKQAASRFRRNADTVIAHADANSAISILLSINFDFTRRYRGLRHSFESIHDKINQDLLNLDRISFDHRQVRIEGSLQLTPVE